MIKLIPGERWKTISSYRNAFGNSYAISNHGRLVCYSKKIKDGSFLKCSLQEGFPIWRFRKKKRDGTYSYNAFLLHRLVAQYFLPKPQKGENTILHHNHIKKDNHFSNLAWCTFQESAIHAQGSPRVKKARRLMQKNGNYTNAKLTEIKVKQIKLLLSKGKTLKEIAEKYKVCDMQIHRIKTGENWGHL